MSCWIKLSSNTFQKVVLYLALLGVLATVSGCVLAPVIQAVSDVGVTEGDRQRLLNKDLRAYIETRRWSDPNGSVAFMSPDLHAAFFEDARKSRSRERIVDGSIEDVMFENDAYSAEVITLLKVYEVPYYVVKEKREKQRWVFGVGGGWLMTERSPVAPERQSIRAGG